MTKHLFFHIILNIYQFKKNNEYFKWLTVDHVIVKLKKKRQITTQL